jgi:catechol 2,3-dioxygenase-like lactoylglutathione lyase family enzyme
VPELKRVRSVLAVRDLRASVAFYRDKLGFTVESEFDGWCFLARDSFRLMIGHCPDAVPASRIDDHSYFAYIEVDGIDALFAEFRSRGLKPLTAPESKPWGMREFMVATPDGHRMMFGEDLERAQ